jgi:hypothetical protein
MRVKKRKKQESHSFKQQSSGNTKVSKATQMQNCCISDTTKRPMHTTTSNKTMLGIKVWEHVIRASKSIKISHRL